jgi:hypothetical protein
VSRQLGLDVVHKEDFHCTPNFRNKIILTYLVVPNFLCLANFLRGFKKKIIKKIFRVKRTYAPDAGRTPLTQRFIKGPNILKTNPIHLVFLSFSLHPNAFKEIFGQVSKGFKGFQLCFQRSNHGKKIFLNFFKVFAILGFV